MKIYFMRHGETDLNRENRLQGQIDCPLNDVGIRQAQDAGKKLSDTGLKFDRIYSSPLIRAVDTAVYVTGAARDRIICDERLLEMGYGPYEAFSFSQLPEEMRAFIFDLDHVPAPEGVEQIRGLMQRTGAFLKELKNINDAESILVVTHGVAIRAILGHICEDGTKAVWGMPIDNCTLYEVRLIDGVYSQE